MEHLILPGLMAAAVLIVICMAKAAQKNKEKADRAFHEKRATDARKRW